MAINLLDMLKDQIGDSVISQAGKFLGAEESGVKSAMGAALPSILGSMISKSSSPSGAGGLMDMISGGGHDGSVFDNLGNVFGGGDATSGFLNSGSGILKSLMGNKLGSVVDIISSVSGLKTGASSSIMSMAAPLVMGMVGRYVKSKALDAIGLGKFLGGQSKHVASALPAGMGSLLGMGGASAASGMATNMGNKVEAAADNARETATAAASGGSSILTRVLPLLLLLGLGYFGWQYFGSTVKDGVSKVGETVGDAASGAADLAGDAASGAADLAGDAVGAAGDAVGVATDAAKGAAGAAADAVGGALDATTKAAREALGSVKFAAGSVGEKFSSFLGGDRSGDATFSFNNLTFATGSAAINDMSEVNNLAAVLKAYPSVNIEVGGHTDSSGNADSNLKLSGDRAESVKAQLVAQGIAADRISTKGYGSTMPTTANAADAANRRVEIKVVK